MVLELKENDHSLPGKYLMEQEPKSEIPRVIPVTKTTHTRSLGLHVGCSGMTAEIRMLLEVAEHFS